MQLVDPKGWVTLVLVEETERLRNALRSVGLKSRLENVAGKVSVRSMIAYEPLISKS